MKISIDTKEDSHEEIKKVIQMLRNLVGENQEVFTNQPISEATASTTENPFTNIFGDSSGAAPETNASSEINQETPQQAETEIQDQSTDDLFAELFSEEEIKKMDNNSAKPEDEEEEEELPKAKSKKYGIELY